ncbi:helicase IV [Campylobacter mucosalis]|uniref:DUF559 domain-containing protein n=1 Tax=Campylobacter mucosalis CCUG 21559 TaxID=1032067 RepID=A0A6G5QIU8_9BACT|nr:helicase IV [Campylobacter mucosalis]QCD45507.1 hypothetical protein CMUC_1758 [Campylobacter mucosalis CCUG 21559]
MDIKNLAILLLLFLVILLLKILLKRQKIKQLRYKSDSGDLVKSRAELVIANWLFHHGFSFMYEKRIQAKERVISDFYLVDFEIYIEFWGLNTPNYVKRKAKKIKIYKKHRLKLIQMDDESLKDLNKFFKAELLKFGIKNLR